MNGNGWKILACWVGQAGEQQSRVVRGWGRGHREVGGAPRIQGLVVVGREEWVKWRVDSEVEPWSRVRTKERRASDGMGWASLEEMRQSGAARRKVEDAS